MDGLFATEWLLLLFLPVVALVRAIFTRRPGRDHRRRYEQALDRRIAEWKGQIRAGQERNSKERLSQ